MRRPKPLDYSTHTPGPEYRSTGLCGALGLQDEVCHERGSHAGWHLDCDTGMAWSPDDPKQRQQFPGTGDPYDQPPTTTRVPDYPQPHA